MVATIAQLIGKVNPKLYSTNGEELLKKYKTLNKIPAEKIKPKSAAYLYSFPEGVQKSPTGDPSAEFKIGYDSSSETLEPLYFWLLDLMNSFGLAPEKLVDNFSSSPGSGHFGEMGIKSSQMQQQAQNIMGQVNTVLRSVINIIYDLKEFKTRLQSYKDLKSKNAAKSEAATLSLKQLWLDKVDIQKGNSSVKAMALGQAGFQTLLDAFLVVKDEESVEKLDLNERVKRIVKMRINEFLSWIGNSEEELKKRYELERTYLKSQVNSLKLYSRWAKPYLKAAADLEQKEQGRAADFVKTFNTIILELSLLGKAEIKPAELAQDSTLPLHFKKYKGRKYYACALLDFKFRGIPQKIQSGQSGHYVFGGKIEINFKGYALNQDEIDMLYQELDKSDLGDVLKLIEGTTTESLEQLEGEIKEFLDEKTPEEEEEEIEKPKETNPFMALLGKTSKKKKKKEDEDEEEKKIITSIKKDSYDEKVLREIAGKKATETVFTLFDVYKKGHRMPSYA
ncbi:hypothetical protein HN832_03755 [archaeon]|jgi:hypothetical protein|nr:hypothetical protein [archaeon]MBT4373490.1 hypothetical protein [archaeon]MBT4531938.1 hypothetical protein [archaeon]MBT7001605.1 hypothetical protein [archaeon]MBT7282503.1 hypothetical protein [archaeon]